MQMHKRRILVGLGFVGCYSFVCVKTVKSKSESLRLAVAGSLANTICELSFHLIDTINVREKVTEHAGGIKSNNTIK
jgi:uncharacterized membrane protein